MSEYILILLVLTSSNNRPAITSILFPTEAACEFAKSKTTTEDAFGKRAWGSAVCVPRNGP
jgi:hypothetical protein